MNPTTTYQAGDVTFTFTQQETQDGNAQFPVISITWPTTGALAGNTISYDTAIPYNDAVAIANALAAGA